MSLKVWIPLIEDYHNQGTEIVDVGNTGATASTSGPLGASYSFNGTNNQITASYTCAESELTVCMWVTFTKLGVHLLDMRNSDNTGYQPMYVSSSGIQVGGSNSSYVYIDFVPTLNTWYHLCVVMTSSKSQLYVNGEFYGETTSAKAANFNKKLDIHLGSRYSGAYWFGGNVSDFRLYNEALSAYEIRDIAKGLLLHYTRPTASIAVGGQVIDSSGFGRNGTVYTASLGHNPINTSRYACRYYTGTSGSYISRISPSSSTKTICFWLLTPKTASTVFFADYKSKLAFGFNASTYIIASCDSFSTKMFASTAISANTQHIAIRKTSDNSDIDLFVNGEQVTTRYTNNYWTHSSDTLMIGQRSTGTPMTNARFSDFRMYATRLSDDDIMQLYKTQLKQFSNGKSSPFELKEDTVGKVQVGKSGLLTNNSFVESTVGNKFKATQVLSNEFIER